MSALQAAEQDPYIIHEGNDDCVRTVFIKYYQYQSAEIQR